MLSILRRFEDLLIQIMRCVLLIFSLLVLIGMSVWVYDRFQTEKPSATASAATLNWSQIQPDLQFVVDETRRDMGNSSSEQSLIAALTDPALRPSLQKADALLRQLINQDPQARAKLEEDHQSRGLALINPLLEGDSLPTAAQIEQYRTEERRKPSAASAAEAAVEAASEAAAAADAASAEAASEADAEAWFSDPVDIPQEINSRANMAELEHGKGAHAAFIQGLPAALEKVLADPQVSQQLREQTAANLVNMLLVNYTMSFDRSANQLAGKDSDEDGDSFWDRSFRAVETAFWSMLMTFLVLVVMVVSMIRMERHLRVISENSKS